MAASDLWAEHGLAIAVALLLGQLIAYVARAPMRRALAAFRVAAVGPFRLTAKASARTARAVAKRNHQVLTETAKRDVEKKIDRELVRVSTNLTRDLRQYPTLHRQLSESSKRLEADLDESAHSPPEVPGWPDAVRAISELQNTGDRASGKLLKELRSVARTSEKKALREYQAAVAERHRILAGAAHRLKGLQQTSAEVLSVVKTALESTSRIDQLMERYEALRRKDEGVSGAVAFEMFGRFVVSLLIMAIALGGAFVNFQLIALPMSELVPAGARLATMPVSDFAALVIVLMEITAGVFVMDALGMTELIGPIGRLATRQRRIVLVVAVTALTLLACIEASLAVLREQIVETDILLKQTIAGEATPASNVSQIALIGQVALGFILPFILTMIAMPLETLIQTVQYVASRALEVTLHASGVVMRILGHVVRYATRSLELLFEVYIALPSLLGRTRPRKSQPRRLAKEAS